MEAVMRKYTLPIKWYIAGNIFFLILSGIALAFLPVASKMLFDTLAGEVDHSFAIIISLYLCVQHF